MRPPMIHDLRPLPGTDLALLVREITGSTIDPQTRARIADVERAGSNVTVFEVLADGALLILAHASARPSLSMLRRAYERHTGAEGGAA